MLGFSGGRPLGAAGAHSCCAGLGAGCPDPRSASGWGRPCSCGAGLRHFRFLRDSGRCTTKAALSGCTAGASPESPAATRRICFRTCAAETTPTGTAAKTAAPGGGAFRCAALCALLREAAAETATPGRTAGPTPEGTAATGRISFCARTTKTAAFRCILGETSTAGSTHASEASTPRGILGKSPAPTSGKATASAGYAACKAAVLRPMEAGKSGGGVGGATGRIPAGGGFFVRFALPAGRRDIAGGPLCTGLY